MRQQYSLSQSHSSREATSLAGTSINFKAIWTLEGRYCNQDEGVLASYKLLRSLFYVLGLLVRESCVSRYELWFLRFMKKFPTISYVEIFLYHACEL
jgi:hypothetical protein